MAYYPCKQHKVSSSSQKLNFQTGAIDDVYKEVSETLDQTKSVEGKQIITDLAKLKYELQHDRALTSASILSSVCTTD